MGSPVSSILFSEDLYVCYELTDGILKSVDKDVLDSKWYCPSL